MNAVLNLALGEDVVATEGKIAEYQRLNHANIARNRALKARTDMQTPAMSRLTDTRHGQSTSLVSACYTSFTACSAHNR